MNPNFVRINVSFVENNSKTTRNHDNIKFNDRLATFGSVSYLDARKKVLCLDLGGSGSYYIDGNDIAAEGTFKWATFEKTFLHENFAAGQPDGGATDDCLAMAFSSGQWDDVDCATQLKSICEFEGRCR